MLFRPAEASKRIVDFYRNYLLTTFQTNKAEYNKQLSKLLLNNNAIAKGPYISLSDSFLKDKSIKDLINDGILSNEMQDLSALHPNRNLYKHQVDSIIKICNGQDLVISTGTGSGKTECFLIPILNELLREKKHNILTPGVRALIIYPMNALVNDQIRRLRDILRTKTEITFGRFTGETKHTYREAKNLYLERELCEPLKNELICREQMRETPPNILITNYAMLEYLLLRPGDSIFFSEKYAGYWKYIVLDEAHTYNGAKGIEVATLLSRLKAMIKRKDINFIITSATLGTKESNDEVVNFASLLCGSNFKKENIIRAETVAPLRFDEISDNDLKLYNQLAEKFRNNEPENSIYDLLNNYSIKYIDNTDIGRTLYNMILHDAFYYRVRKILHNQTKTLLEVSKELSISENDLTDFIAVASNAEKDGDRIFEARYHMFIRGIEGVYVSLNPSNKLFISRLETYKENLSDESDCGYKVFEISFCHNCSAIFIIGQTDEKGVLIQKSKYNDDYEPEVYLLEGEFDSEEENNNVNSYIICAKCGAIKKSASLPGLSCGHDKKYYNILIKVKENNIVLNKCPSCRIINTQRSIIRPFFLGNEAATSVIATALYNELPDIKITKDIITYKDDFFGESGTKEIIHKKKLTKQFLAFSDNRQAAAFFASYLSYTYRESLIKRLMSEVAVEHKKELSNSGLSLERFVGYVEELMERYNVGEKDGRSEEAWVAVIKEAVNFKAKNSLQNLGILFFDTEDIDLKANDKLNLTIEELNILFKVMCSYFVKCGAIHYPITLNRTNQKRITLSGFDVGFEIFSSTNKYLIPWLPKGEANNKTKYLSKIVNNDALKVLLENIWGILFKRYYISYQNNKYKLDYQKLRIKIPEKLYICNKCKLITPYNIKNSCINGNCNGELVEYDFINSIKNPHYKNLYTKLTISDLIAKEHTAQLSSERAYEYQNDFINKKINVLSCSTTFELGVDVGTLETVFMRNVPPSPANYAQRAGRAGRSTKAAAYSLTFCPNNSHDLNYFKEPLSMIKGSIQPPNFNVNNDKIVIRHIFASAFSFFWRLNINMYTQYIGEFIDRSGPEEFIKYLLLKPKNLSDYLNDVLSDDLKKHFDINNYGWFPILHNDSTDNPGVLDIAVRKYNLDNEELMKAYEKYDDLEKKAAPGSRERIDNSRNKRSVDFAIRTLREQRLIEFLSRNNLIPKYGFPVDTVELKSFGTGGSTAGLRLDRDLFSAISEYAPESEVVADGKLIKSRYVRVLKGYSWPKYKYVTCPNCNTLNKTLWTDVENKLNICRQCEHDLSFTEKRQYIIPSFGFVMECTEPEPVGINKPERTYKGAISYIGDDNKINFRDYNINNSIINLGTSPSDSLAVLNESNFFICDDCGYGEIGENSRDNLIAKEHQNYNGIKCSNKRLIKYALGHEFKTDVVLIKFQDFNIENRDEAWSILYSLLEGLSRYLNIERNEISGCLHWYRNTIFGRGNYCFVLFDNTPGGAGYVRQIDKEKVLKSMFEKAYDVVKNCTCGGELADSACYGCLCNYYNQKHHDIIKRNFAINFFQKLGISHLFPKN